MSPPLLSVHAVDTYPVIRFLPEAAVPGYAARWVQDMDALLARGEPFAVIYPESSFDETHEDRKIRGQWLKQYRDALAALCRALVTIEPDEQRREALQAQLDGLSRAFGVPQTATATHAQALDLARSSVSDKQG
ncbi:Uncharacterised protein [Bordetella ansorpii]|uniref:Uncharacterized protein n=1 Tax=Bordetella ansorpii TaxID=288768 RepID=A0A157LJ49_9BORD|nr:hypothetical protein [Bordetella ansorpii]SAH96309.1 Uncharacterised protein [Bordetella ansorpii]